MEGSSDVLKSVEDTSLKDTSLKEDVEENSDLPKSDVEKGCSDAFVLDQHTSQSQKESIKIKWNFPIMGDIYNENL